MCPLPFSPFFPSVLKNILDILDTCCARPFFLFSQFTSYHSHSLHFRDFGDRFEAVVILFSHFQFSIFHFQLCVRLRFSLTDTIFAFRSSPTILDTTSPHLGQVGLVGQLGHPPRRFWTSPRLILDTGSTQRFYETYGGAYDFRHNSVSFPFFPSALADSIAHFRDIESH